MLGLKEADVAPLVRAVAGDELDRDHIEERFARAAWSGIAEPGDRVAGALIQSLGAARALAGILERRSAESIAAEAAEVTAPEVRLALERWTPRLASASALLALRQAARFGARLLVPGDPLWPGSVDDLGTHAPLALWVRGTDAALAALGSSIALVGARAATGYGEHVTMECTAGLADRGYTIVSGAAYGIDGIAHRTALASQALTVAFLAGGVDRFYPSGHDALLSRVVDTGAVVSELPCGSSPTKWRFLQRNRLIAAASLATVVVEAGWRSGSLNTAGHANDLSRPLGAVPGPVTSSASTGCHRLVREYGATLVTNAAEMAELAPIAGGALDGAALDGPEEPRDAVRHEHVRVLDALSTRSPRPVVDVAARSGMSVGEVQSVLGVLELDGLTRETDRGWVKGRARTS